MRRKALLGTAAAAIVAGRYLTRARASTRNDEDAPGRSAADADLDLMFAQVASLRELAADVEQGDGRVYDFSIRWGTWLAGRLHRLVHYYNAGELSAAERERYEQLVHELHDLEPLIDELGLARPPSTAAR